MLSEEIIQKLTEFDSALKDLVDDHLGGQVTKDQVNEFYSWINDCQISEILESAEELDVELKKSIP